MDSSTCSQAGSAPPSLVEILSTSVLPQASWRTGRLLPSLTEPTECNAGFQEIFPYGFQWHDSFEWLWLVDNWTHIKVQDSIYRMVGGDVCLIPPGVPHAELYSPATPAHRSLWFAFHAESACMRVNIYRYESFGNGRVTESHHVKVPPIVGPLLLAWQSELTRPQQYGAEICRSIVHQLLTYCTRALETVTYRDQSSSPPQPVSSQIVDFLEEHYAEDITLEKLGRLVHLNRNYLSEIFKRETGKTIGQTLTEIRLRKAKSLLIEPGHTIRDVAAQVGFRSPEHFARLFHRYERVTPRAYCR